MSAMTDRSASLKRKCVVMIRRVTYWLHFDLVTWIFCRILLENCVMSSNIITQAQIFTVLKLIKVFVATKQF